ncbi:MAG: hypothetical protein AAB817_02455 [Patescibacteria group bacterium]
MSSYGWTLEQALDLTLPQVSLLFRAMGKYPTLPAFLGSFVGSMSKDRSAEAALSKLGASGAARAATGAGQEFWRDVGLTKEA